MPLFLTALDSLDKKVNRNKASCRSSSLRTYTKKEIIAEELITNELGPNAASSVTYWVIIIVKVLNASHLWCTTFQNASIHLSLVAGDGRLIGPGRCVANI